MSTADVRIVTSLEGLQGVRTGLDSIGKTAASLNQPFQNLSSSLKSVGTTMSVAVTAPLAAWGAQILKTGAQFDTQMRQVNALLGGTTEDMKKLEAAALSMGKSTSFSASEVADGFGVLAQAGYDANTTIKLTSDIINLAGAEMISFRDAASITTNTLSQFGLSTNEAALVIDKFVTIGAASKTSVTEMGAALEKVGPVARSAGQSFDEMLIALGSLAETGIKGEVAGTALAMALAKLQAPTDAGAAALKELGVQVTDGTGKLRPFTDIIADLSAKGATYSQVADLMTQESAKYIISMLNSTEAARKFSEALGGPLLSAAEIAAVKMKGLEGAWNSFTGSLETLNITLARSGMEEWATDILNAGSGLIDMLTDLNPNVLKFGSAIAVAAAATGPIVLGLGLAAGAVAAIGAPVALAIAGITALAATLWTFRDRLKPVADAAAPLFEFIATAWARSISKIRALFDQVVAGFRESFVTGIGRVMSLVPGLIAGHLVNISRVLIGFAPAVSDNVSDWFRNIRWSDIVRIISTGARAVGQAILDYFRGFSQGFASASGIDLQKIGTVAVDLIAEAVRHPKALVQQALLSLFEVGNQLANAVRDRFAELAPAVVEGAKLTSSRALAGVTEALKALFDVTGQLGAVVREKFASLSSAIVDGLKQAVDQARAILGSVWTTLFGDAGTAVQQMGQKVDEATPKIANLTQGAQNSLASIERFSSGLRQNADALRLVGGSGTDTINIIEDLGSTISGTTGDIEVMGSAGRDLLGVTNALTPSLTQASEAMRLVGGTGTDTLEALNQEWGDYQGTVETVSSATSGFLESSMHSIRGVVRDVITDGKINFESLKNAAIGNFADMLVDGVMKFVTSGGQSILGMTASSTQAMASMGTQGQGIFSSLGNFASQVFQSIGSIASNVLSSIVGFFSNMGSAAGSILSGIASTAQSIFSSIANWASSTFSGVSSAFSSVVSGVSSGISKISGWLGDLGKTASSVLGTLGSIAGNAATGAGIGNIVSGITGGNSTAGAIGGAVGNIIGASSWFAGTGLGTTLGSAAGPLGAIAGALLGNLVGSLFNSKPSDKNQFADVNFSTGKVVRTGGQGGDKYSQENRTAAVKIGNVIAQLAKQVQNITGGRLSEGVSVNVGSRDGVKLIFGAGQKAVRYASVDALIEAAYRFMVRDDLEGGDKNKLAARGFKVFATGGDSIFTRSTLLEVGEAGPERVTVQKLNGSYGAGGGSGITLNLNAPIYANDLSKNELMRDIVRQAERENFRRRGRRQLG